MLTFTSAEEVEDAGRTLPRSIMWSVYINGAMGFIMAITMCFCLGDLAELAETPTGVSPFLSGFSPIRLLHRFSTWEHYLNPVPETWSTLISVRIE